MLKDGRIPWPVFCMVVFSAVTVVATDYAWRMLQAPVGKIAAIGIAVLAAGNLALFVLGRRTR